VTKQCVGHKIKLKVDCRPSSSMSKDYYYSIQSQPIYRLLLEFFYGIPSDNFSLNFECRNKLRLSSGSICLPTTDRCSCIQSGSSFIVCHRRAPNTHQALRALLPLSPTLLRCLTMIIIICSTSLGAAVSALYALLSSYTYWCPCNCFILLALVL